MHKVGAIVVWLLSSPEMVTHHHFLSSSQARKNARLGTFTSGSIKQNNPDRNIKMLIFSKPALFAPLLSITTVLGNPL
jgi:hypothetical protein